MKRFIVILLIVVGFALIALLFNKVIWESGMPFWLKWTLTK